MVNKSLDRTFIQQGIRQEDLDIIERVAQDFDIDFEWVQNLLQNFHEKKIKNPEIEERDISRLIEEHLQKIND